jgi:hypothetical protein
MMSRISFSDAERGARDASGTSCFLGFTSFVLIADGLWTC